VKKKLNLNELVWFLILLGFTCYFYNVINTDRITSFVHPKMVKYVKFALYFFIILVAFQGKNIFNNKKSKSLKIGYIMFLIPLTLGILLKSEGVSAENVIRKGFSLTSQSKINILKHKHITLADGTELCEHDEKDVHPTENANILLKNSLENMGQIKGEILHIDNENFINTYEDIYGNSQNYVGRDVSMKGFIYRQQGLYKDEFILSRIAVSCCMADAQLMGILCDYNQEEILPEGIWVSIEGTLGQREYVDPKSGEINMIPMIIVNKIEKDNNQKNEYIYN
jgi:putative membrane protein